MRLTRKMNVLVLICAIIALLVFSGDANALIITSGCADTNVSCTMQELMDGGTIRIDDKLFDKWYNEDYSSPLLDLSQIDVIPLDDQPLNPGLRYLANGQLSIGPGVGVIDIGFDFDVATLDGSARIKDNTLALLQWGITGSAGFSIYESVTARDGTFDLLGEKEVGLLDDLDQSFDSLEFEPRSSINALAWIRIGTDGGPTDSINVEGFEQRFSQIEAIPEPATLLLLGGGLLGLGAFRKKFRK